MAVSRRSTSRGVSSRVRDESPAVVPIRRMSAKPSSRRASTPIVPPTPTKPITRSSRTLAKEEPALGPNGSPLGADHDGSGRFVAFCRRLWAGLALFSVFCLAIHLGHSVLLPLIFLIQVMMYKELVDLSYTHLLENQYTEFIPLFHAQNWYWFVVASFFCYARVLNTYTDFKVPYDLAISFAGFSLGLVWFVLTLEQKFYRIQFSMFAWSWLSLLVVIVGETTAVASVMFRGLIWLVLPAILIMTNDTWAYIWGMMCGRTSLLELSPKKTWEGFLGAIPSTCLQGFLMARGMAPWPILTCPQTIFTLAHPVCEVSPLFQLSPYALPFTIPGLGWDHILIAPIQWHAVYLAILASLIAPFGGYFGSGFKRAFSIKDFGTLIPGHGGFTDRMDCQLIMGLIVYAYFFTLIEPETFADVVTATVATPQTLAAAVKALSQSDSAVFRKLVGLP